MCVGGCALGTLALARAEHIGAAPETPTGGAATRQPEHYGAVGDGITDDTDAVRNAAAALGDGETLLFSTGRTYLTGPWNVTEMKNVNVVVESGSSIQALGMDRWPESSCLPNFAEAADSAEARSSNARHACSPFIRFTEVEGLKVSGGGVVDGAGKLWWEEHDHVRDAYCSLPPS